VGISGEAPPHRSLVGEGVWEDSEEGCYGCSGEGWDGGGSAEDLEGGVEVVGGGGG